ncbi:MAG: DUF3617 domain-containing protein [Candidatus Omnitrophica bacterium]|nr:DUF3617 domain-containing protein [Candidatus Omnitrophota bacterium]MDE2222443.1 DUF3617 domain-containing protein [Candidatus Omnitrophota bacterium]
MRTISSMLAVVLLIAFSSTAKALDFKSGQWQLTMVTKMEHMPPEMATAMEQMKNMPPEAKAQMEAMQKKMGITMSANGQGMTVTTDKCLTEKNFIPSHVGPGQEKYCRQTHQVNGNTVTFQGTCRRGDWQLDSSGTMTYSENSMQGHMKVHQVTGSRTMDSTIDMTGKYLGPCTN